MGEFKRYDGYVMHIPQEFIDSHLPVCPFCHCSDPHWLLDSRMELSWSGTRTYYRCERCGATMSSTAVDAAAEKGKAFAFNPAAAAINAAQKGSKQQEVGVTYLRVDELGNVFTDDALLGQEHPITFYQEMAGTHSAPAVQPAPAPVATPAAPQPQSVAAAPFAPAEAAEQEEEPRIWSIFALIGMILGIVGMGIMLIPYVNSALIIVPISAIVLSAMGKRSSSYRKANTGMTLGIISTAISIVMAAVYAAILN